MSQTLTVACPAGVVPGQQIQLTLPQGGAVTVAVPPGVSPGQQFQVQIGAAPAAAPPAQAAQQAPARGPPTPEEEKAATLIQVSLYRANPSVCLFL